MDLSLSEQLTYSTVRIECQYDDGGSGTGTGFFFKFLENKQTGLHVPVVITNKHVINGSTKGRLLFTKADIKGEPQDREHLTVFLINSNHIGENILILKSIYVQCQLHHLLMKQLREEKNSFISH